MGTNERRIRVRKLHTWHVRHADPAIAARDDDGGLGLDSPDIRATSTTDAVQIAFEQWENMWPTLALRTATVKLHITRTHWADGEETGFSAAEHTVKW